MKHIPILSLPIKIINYSNRIYLQVKRVFKCWKSNQASNLNFWKDIKIKHKHPQPLKNLTILLIASIDRCKSFRKMKITWLKKYVLFLNLMVCSEFSHKASVFFQMLSSMWYFPWFKSFKGRILQLKSSRRNSRNIIR